MKLLWSVDLCKLNYEGEVRMAGKVRRKQMERRRWRGVREVNWVRQESREEGRRGRYPRNFIDVPLFPPLAPSPTVWPAITTLQIMIYTSGVDLTIDGDRLNSISFFLPVFFPFKPISLTFFSFSLPMVTDGVGSPGLGPSRLIIDQGDKDG